MAHRLIDQHRPEIALLCRRYGGRRFEVFGSAARGGDFDPATSDADFLVDFNRPSRISALHRFFGFEDELDCQRRGMSGAATMYHVFIPRTFLMVGTRVANTSDQSCAEQVCRVSCLSLGHNGLARPAEVGEHQHWEMAAYKHNRIRLIPGFL